MGRAFGLVFAITGVAWPAACQQDPAPVPAAPIQIDLPRTAPTPAREAPSVLVYCDPQATRIEFGPHRWQLPERPSGKDLQPLILALGDGRDKAQVILYAASSLPYERVLAVMDALRAAGLGRLAVAVPKARSR